MYAYEDIAAMAAVTYSQQFPTGLHTFVIFSHLNQATSGLPSISFLALSVVVTGARVCVYANREAGIGLVGLITG